MLDTYIGRRIREKRLKAGLTLNDLAEKLHISHQQVQKYEQAQSKISATMLYRLSEILGVEPSYFFQGFEIFQKKQEDRQQQSNVIIPNRRSNLNVLLIEDNVADELLTRKAFADSAVFVNLLNVHDGLSALDCLRNRMTNLDFPRPDIILLDLNLPKSDGASILRELKRDRELNDIPVIILTNSVNFSEMISCYRFYASGYICKPFDYETYQKIMEYLVLYWSQTVILPNRARGEVT